MQEGKKHPNRKRNKQLSFRLSDDEMNVFQSRLKSSQMGQEAFLRSLALGKAIVVIDGLPEAYKELRAIGNNVNQLARAVNGGKSNAREETAELVREVHRLWLMLRLLQNRVQSSAGQLTTLATNEKPNTEAD